MSCGFFDVACHIGNGWGAVLGWALSWLSVNFIVGLFLGSLLGAQFRWLAPFAIGLAVLLRIAPRLKTEAVTEHVEPDSPDAAPPVLFPRRKPKREHPARPKVGDLMDRFTRNND